VGRSITDIMMGQIKVDDIMVTPGMDNLNIITSGMIPTHPAEFLNSPVVPELIEEISENYDFVIFDAPPVLPVADPIILGSKVDGVFLVYKVGNVSRYALKRAKSLLENVGAKVVSTILNDFKPEASPDFFHGNYYHYPQKDNFDKKNGETIAEKISSFVEKVTSFNYARKDTLNKSVGETIAEDYAKKDNVNKKDGETIAEDYTIKDDINNKDGETIAEKVSSHDGRFTSLN
jgi:Mrp family chromosome partitioning ATPase